MDCSPPSLPANKQVNKQSSKFVVGGCLVLSVAVLETRSDEGNNEWHAILVIHFQYYCERRPLMGFMGSLLVNDRSCFSLIFLKEIER